MPKLPAQVPVIWMVSPAAAPLMTACRSLEATLPVAVFLAQPVGAFTV